MDFVDYDRASEDINDEVELRAREMLRKKNKEIEDAQNIANKKDEKKSFSFLRRKDKEKDENNKQNNQIEKEPTEEELREARKIARKDMLSEMEFAQEYKKHQHIGNLEEQSRSLDNQNISKESQKMYIQSLMEDKRYYEESDLLHQAGSGFNVHSIVDSYEFLAEYYNMNNDIEVRKIIDRALVTEDKTIDSEAFKNLIPDPSKKEEFSNMVQEKGGKINIQDLLTQSNENKINMVSRMVGEVASNDINTRAEGLHKKIDVLKDAEENSILAEEIYDKAKNELDDRIQQLRSEDVAKCIQNEMLSDVQEELEFIKDREKELTPEKKTDVRGEDDGR